jgi:hypothetical protein
MGKLDLDKRGIYLSCLGKNNELTENDENIID